MNVCIQLWKTKSKTTLTRENSSITFGYGTFGILLLFYDVHTSCVLAGTIGLQFITKATAVRKKKLLLLLLLMLKLLYPCKTSHVCWTSESYIMEEKKIWNISASCERRFGRMCLRQFEQLHGNMSKIARNIKHVSTLLCVSVCVQLWMQWKNSRATVGKSWAVWLSATYTE